MFKTCLGVVVALLLCALLAGCDTSGGDSSAQSSSTIFDDQIQAHKKAQELEELQKAAEKRAEQMP